MMEEIKRCPFCGGIAIALQVGEDRDDKQYQVICPWNDEYETGCGGASGFCDTLQEAITLWNRRAET